MSRARTLLGVLVPAVALLHVAACGDDDAGAQRICDPGATQRCVCADGMGVQSCADDGERWDACTCGPSIDGGGDLDGAPRDDSDASTMDGGASDGDSSASAPDGGTTDDASTLDGAGAGGDGGASGDAGATDDAGGSLGDASIPPGSCAAPRAPDHETRLTTTRSFYFTSFPRVFVAGGTVFAIGPYDGWRRWYRWSGTDWVPEDVPWPAGVTVASVDRVVRLDDGTVALLVATDPMGSCWPSPCIASILRFDGTRFDAPVALDPEWAIWQKGFARTTDGRWHVLVRDTDEPWTLRSGDASGFGIATPVPVPDRLRGDSGEVAMVAVGDRLVVAYVDAHLFRVHRALGEDWSAPVDLTPEWAVGVAGLLLVPARDGGVMVGVTGTSTSYRFPYMLRSPDGIAFDVGEYLHDDLGHGLLDLDASCLDSPVALLHGGYGTGPQLFHRDGAEDWRLVEGAAGWPNGGGSVAVLPDGRVFWAYQQNDEAVTEFSVTMRATRD